ncbi:hypothetical protein Dsin_017513 [Dipteronia sinensis]|uniref:Uncharacterized protein n=1 Tax=Dipteronia sinensis TaxID=43782 RepID=A0AAE0AGH8_9ROSI|nr:hypothetical protein Dsin_017513 [Dipteronia sinensis]
MLVGQESLIYINNTIALKNVYHLNVSGNDILPSGNSNKQKAIIGGGLLLALAIGFCVVAATPRRRRGKDQSPSDGPSGWLPHTRLRRSNMRLKTLMMLYYFLGCERWMGAID